MGYVEIIARGAAAAEALPSQIVYAGFSLGALPAQFLAQARPGARGALLLHGGCADSSLGDYEEAAELLLQRTLVFLKLLS